MNSNHESLNELTQRVENLTKRYNHLAEISEEANKKIHTRDENIKDLTQAIHLKLGKLRAQLNETEELATTANITKRKVSDDFKQIAKKDAFAKLERRINRLKYEEFISRDELDRLLNR